MGHSASNGLSKLRRKGGGTDLYVVRGRLHGLMTHPRSTLDKSGEGTMQSAKEKTLPRRDYQPSPAELKEEHDMPGADMERLRKAFFEPVNLKEKQTTRP
ncbi:MAG: hypothetical protein OXC02_04780 [Rhodobacteraceae bacterium]|nr:hypothetical protein [Paracoccaceae bacterium]